MDESSTLNLSINDLKTKTFVYKKQVPDILIQIFHEILERAITALQNEKDTPEQKIKLSDYYNVFNKDTQAYDANKFKSLLGLAINENQTFRSKDPVAKFFTYRAQKPTKTDFFQIFQDHLCTQKAYRTTSTVFLQTAAREYIIKIRNQLREIKAEGDAAAALAYKNRDKRAISETKEKTAGQLYQYFTEKLAPLTFQQEQPMLEKLIDEKYSDKAKLKEIKKSSDILVAEFTNYRQERPALDYFIMLFIGYLNKEIDIFEETLRNHKENVHFQLLSLFLLKRIAKSSISDETVIYRKLTDYILTITENHNDDVVFEMIKVAISLNQTLFQPGEEKGISNILSALVNKGFNKVAISILKENPKLNNEGALQNYIRHELTVHYTVRDALLSGLHNY